MLRHAFFWNMFWKSNIFADGFWLDNSCNYRFCKILFFSQDHANFFRIFVFVELYLLSHIDLLKRIFSYFAKMETNSLFSLSLMSSFFSFLLFWHCWRIQCKNQIRFPICLMFLQMKVSCKCSLTYFTIQNIFIKLLTDFIEESHTVSSNCNNM